MHKRTEISLSLDLRCVLLARIRVFLLLACMHVACIADAVPMLVTYAPYICVRKYVCVCVCICVYFACNVTKEHIRA